MATKNDTSMTIRMNSEIKQQAQLLFAELGLDMSTAINIFLRQSVRESRIPFEICADPFYSEENMARLRKSIAQMESTGGTIHEVPLDD